MDSLPTIIPTTILLSLPLKLTSHANINLHIPTYDFNNSQTWGRTKKGHISSYQTPMWSTRLFFKKKETKKNDN